MPGIYRGAPAPAGRKGPGLGLAIDHGISNGQPRLVPFGGELHAAYSCLTMSTEISTAGIVPRFSSQWVVFLSSGQPTPGP